MALHPSYRFKDNSGYDNFVLANEIEDQFLSYLDLEGFCTIDDSLTGTAGMVKKIHVYSAGTGNTSKPVATEKLTVGNGNTQTIKVSMDTKEYEILMAQNRFVWYDEEDMTDPMIYGVGVKYMATDMFNEVNKDIYAEFNKTTQEVKTGGATTINFGNFVDAIAKMNVESLQGDPAFAFVNPTQVALIRKSLKDDLKYVEAYSRNGYVGSVAGVPLYARKTQPDNCIMLATKDAVTMFHKRGVEVETPVRSADDANVRKNTIFSRKYYLPALTDATKAVKISLVAE